LRELNQWDWVISKESVFFSLLLFFIPGGDTLLLSKQLQSGKYNLLLFQYCAITFPLKGLGK